MVETGNKQKTALLFLIGGTVTFGFSSLFVKLCDFPATVIAAVRIIAAGIIIIPFAYTSIISLYKKHSLRELFVLAIPGILLGLHFQAWVWGIKNTYIATGTFIFSTNPVLFAVTEKLIYKRRVKTSTVFSLILVILGGLWIFVIGNGRFGQPGNIFCLLATVIFVLYLLSAKRYSKGLTHASFIHLIYLWGGIAMLPFVFISGDFKIIQFNDTYSYLFLMLLVIFPTLIGHTSSNYAVRYFSPLFVSFFTLFEPLLSSVAAFIFLREKPELMLYPGYIMLITASLIYFLSKFQLKHKKMGR